MFALAPGADKSLFCYGDWIKKPGVAIVGCNDGLRPVIMKPEAADEGTENRLRAGTIARRRAGSDRQMLRRMVKWFFRDVMRPRLESRLISAESALRSTQR